MTQIITSRGGGGGGGGGACYTAGNGIDITNNEISVDENVVQTTDNLVTNLTNPDDTHYPSAKAVSDAITSSGGGDMLKSVYDPNNISADAFDYDNFTNTPTIPTDNCQLANGCCYAKTCDIPTDNCQLANGCGYTTCTGTLTASNISNTAYGSSWSGVTTVAPSKNAVYAKVNSIDAVIPSAATSSNQLADKNYVNDSINSVTAFYITKDAQGNQWASYAELAAATTFYSGGAVRVPTRNDYTVVLDDETHNNATTRYSYQGSGWEYQYTVHDTPLTQAQLDALNSGITAAKVSTYDGYVYDIADKQDELVSGVNIRTINGTSILGSGDIVTPVGPTYSAGTGISLANDTITNTGVNSFNGSTGAVTYTAPVTSVNGQTGAVTVEEGITKIFTLSSTSDLTNAQAAYDRYVNGGNPIIEYGGIISGGRYVLVTKSATQLEFALLRPQNGSTTSGVYIRAAKIRLIASSSVVTTIYSYMNTISIASTAPTTDNKQNITLVI